MNTAPSVRVPGSEGAVELAADPTNGYLWIRGSKGFLRYRLEGRKNLSIPSPAARGNGASYRLAAVAADGSAWLAAGRTLRGQGSAGQAFHERELPREILDLALGDGGSVLWLTTGNGVLALDAITGVALRELDLPAGFDARALAPDADSAALWVAGGGRVLRFDEAGELKARGAGGGDVDLIVTDGRGGAWLSRRQELVHLDGEGRVEGVLEPLGSDEAIAHLVYDPAHRAVWVQGGASLLQVGAEGWILDRRQVGEETVADLALFGGPADASPPVVKLEAAVAPELASRDPRVRLIYADEGSGVRRDSAAFLLDGQPVDARCTYRPGWASCRLEARLGREPVDLSVTVEDQLGNVSAPSARRFAVADKKDAQGDEEPLDSLGDRSEQVPGEGVYTPVVSPRGLRPNKPFVAGKIDSIDTASGNLTLRVPLGQRYEVGPHLSYQILAVNNSNAWNHIRTGCPPAGCPPPLSDITFSLTNPNSNAGVGWELHFGRLYTRAWPTGLDSLNRKRWPVDDGDSPDGLNRWLYVAPDGAQHYLFRLGGRAGGSGGLPIRYSKDGSFLRMRQVDANTIHVEQPNGLYSVFKKTGQQAGTQFCGGGVSGCWRFHEKRDAYGNFMRVTYAVSGNTETWTVTDSAGRTHRVFFDTSNAVTGGGDGPPEFRTQDGDEWGDLRRVVTRVDTATFGGGVGRYNFGYQIKTMARGCPHDAIELPASARTLRAPVLAAISVPHSQPYRFQTWAQGGGSCSKLNGRVSEVTLPTLGKIAYEYSNNWAVPTRCSYTFDDNAEFDFNVTAVRRRLTKNRAGTTQGVTTYSSDLFPTTQNLVLSGQNCSRADFRKTIVDGPVNGDGKHVRTVYYNSVAQGPRVPTQNTPISNFQVTDNGLPFTKSSAIGGSNATKQFLSKEVFQCTGSSCARKRRHYVRYATEWRGCSKVVGDSAGCYQVNPLQVKQRTIYDDDGGKYVENENQQYDGAGHFRRTITRDNFSGTTTRTVTTNYTATGATTLGINGTTGYVNVGTPSSYLPAPGARWILTPFNKITHVDSGRTYVTEYQFDNKGSMTCTRAWKGSGGRSAKDRVVSLTLGTAAGTNLGLPVTEVVSGGEFANISTGGLCRVDATTTNGRKYTFSHAYQFLTLKSTRIGSFPFRYRADIDRNTGLPRAIYNPSDQKTTLSYDQLGRLRHVTPAASLGEATTEHVYRNPAGADPSIDTFRRQASTVVTKMTEVMDHFGRPIREIVRRPSGNASFVNSRKDRVYDNAGQLRRVTTLQTSGSFNTNKAWRFSNYDAFGRAGRMRRPDDHVENLVYFGDRQKRSTVAVRTSLSGTTNVQTNTFFDSKGRTVRESNPEHNTFFTYDPYDRQVTARRSGPGVNQTREFGFDARGLKLFEKHPEIAGNGGRELLSPDALGLPRRVRDGLHNLTYDYDGDGRMFRIRNTSGGQVWKTWSWANANSGSNYKKGKVVRAGRYNYPTSPTDIWLVEETYEYRGKLGKLSKKTTQVRFPNNTGDDRWGVTFQETYGYDVLGNRRSLSYPTCITTPENGRRMCNDGPNDRLAPNHSVTTFYNQGLARRVQSNLGPAADFTYHGNLQLASMSYSNGILGTFDQGTNGLPRPRRLLYKKGAAVRFDTGVYNYDAAGNIWQMGADRFYYDRASRLRYGTVAQAGANRREEYTYDAADNVLSRRTDGGSLQQFRIDDNRNRFLAGTLTGPVDTFYDNAGNTLSVGLVGGTPRWEMRYDGLNKQTHFITNTPGQPQHQFIYLYGPNDYRLAFFDTSNGQRTYRFRDPEGKVLREFTVLGWGPYVNAASPGAAWTHQKDFIHGAEGLVATRSRTGVQRFFLKDHLGSPRVITDGAGGQRGRHHYYPFGAEVPLGAQEDEPVAKFTGHERDPSGLSDYMLGRTYFFPIYRFATVDVARDGWNLYAYARNNPIRNIDPNGFVSKDTVLGALSIGIGFVPILGDLKDAQEAIFGVDLVTGDTLSAGERLLAGAAVLLPVVNSKALREGAGLLLKNTDEAVEGTATIRKHGRGHVSVEVNQGADGLATHQVHADNKTKTFIVNATTSPPSKPVTSSVTVDLPNAGAARARQEELLGQGNLGPYDRVTNSCISHVCDVLSAGGVDAPAPNGSAQSKFVLGLLKGDG